MESGNKHSQSETANVARQPAYELTLIAVPPKHPSRNLTTIGTQTFVYSAVMREPTTDDDIDRAWDKAESSLALLVDKGTVQFRKPYKFTS